MGIKSNATLVGQYGEKVAQYYLKTKGYSILGCNIRLKVGEIDILAFKNNVFHIVEVKTMNFPKVRYFDCSPCYVFDSIQPEDALSRQKIKKLKLLASELRLHIMSGLEGEVSPLKMKTCSFNRFNIENVSYDSTQDIQIDAVTVRLYTERRDLSKIYKIKLRYIPFL